MKRASDPINPIPILAALAMAFALLSTAGCQPASPADDAFVVADLFATPGKAIVTPALSPTPAPDATDQGGLAPTPGPTLPLPTGVVLQQPTQPIGTVGPLPSPGAPLLLTPFACNPPPMPFTPVWQNIEQAKALMRCPVGGIEEVPGVFQRFEHGVMFWRESDKSIFVISELRTRQGEETDSWWRVADTFRDGEPEDDPALQPPNGLLQPVRGFGKAWRSNAFIREALGWAVGSEAEVSSLWQHFEGGWMMTGPGGNPIYVMAPLDDPPYSSGIHLGPLP
jgi:hypothetical protein